MKIQPDARNIMGQLDWITHGMTVIHSNIIGCILM